MYRLLLGLAAAALVLIGCNANPPAPPTPPAPTVSHDTANADDSAAVKRCVVAYYNAVVNNDKATIDYLWYPNPTPKGYMGPSGTKQADIKSYTLDFIGTENSELVAYVTVTVDLGPNPGGAWSPGLNMRWGRLIKHDGQWQIHAMATSPHAYAK